MRRAKSNLAASVLIWTVVVIGILSLIAVELLRLVTVKYQNALQTSTWQEALLAAESGIDVAIVELRKSLYPAPNNAWQGWTSQPGNNVTGYELTTVPNAGLNSTPMTIEANVDAPASLIDPTNGWQYYRIRTVGTIPPADLHLFPSVLHSPATPAKRRARSRSTIVQKSPKPLYLLAFTIDGRGGMHPAFSRARSPP